MLVFVPLRATAAAAAKWVHLSGLFATDYFPQLCSAAYDMDMIRISVSRPGLDNLGLRWQAV